MIYIAKRKKQTKKKKKPSVSFQCKHCGKAYKTKKGLVSHEKKCTPSKKDLEDSAKKAPETLEIFSIAEDLDESKVEATEQPEVIVEDDISKPADSSDVKQLKEAHERELARLQSQFQQLSDQEKQLASEREVLQQERSDLYNGLIKTKPRSAGSVIEPFSELTEEGDDELPGISGPLDAAITEETEPAAETAQTQEDVDLSAKAEQLRKDVLGSSKGIEPDASEKGPVSAVESGKKSLYPPSDQALVGDELETGTISSVSEETIINALKVHIESEFSDRLHRHESMLDELNSLITDQDKTVNKLENIISKLVSKDIMTTWIKQLDKIEIKVNEMGEEVGFGESLNVSKIPPSILVSVYEGTLEDVVKAIIRNIGPYDTETLVGKILEEIRTQTSGSELFKFEDGKLRIKELAKNLENKSISAKQIQATYTEILQKLMDHVPGYKPKNFRAMLKIKSQEFAVDKASGFTEVLNELQRNIQDIKNANAELNDRLIELEEDRNTLSSDVRVIEQKINELYNHSKGSDASSDSEEDSSESSDDSDTDDWGTDDDSDSSDSD